MQKAETSLIPSQDKPKVAKLLEILVDEQQKIYVNWPVDKKELCIMALGEAVKLVGLYKVPEPPKPRISDFIRGVKP